MSKKFKCSMCGAEFDDIDEFESHVKECINNYKNKLENENKEKKLQKINGYIDAIKTYEKYIENVKDEFKKEFPKEYELNFGKNNEIISSFYGNINGKEFNSKEEFYDELDKKRKHGGLFGNVRM